MITSHADIALQSAENVTAHGGAVIIDALARDFGLWDRIKALPLLDHRTDKSRGFSPEVFIARAAKERILHKGKLDIFFCRQPELAIRRESGFTRKNYEPATISHHWSSGAGRLAIHGVWR